MSGSFIWDAVATLVIGSIIVGAVTAMAIWSTTEVLKTADRHFRPHLVRWVRTRVRNVRQWKKSRSK